MMMTKLEVFLNIKGFDISLAEKLEKYMSLILEWNEKINVTAVKNPEEFMAKNIIDSLTICGKPEISTAERVLELGTGGGLPGIPLAIVYPEKSFVLMDAVGKKLKVVQAVADEIGLSNVATVHGRAEDLARKGEYREQFDLVVSRAVANLSTLSEYCIPFVKIGGSFTAFKTEAAEEEISAASSAVKKLGGVMNPFEQDGVEGSGHGFVRIDKVSTTSPKYPRKAGLPSKDPLK